MPVTSGRIPNPLLLDYICSHCGSHLKRTEIHIDIQSVTEDCPTCGTPLSKTLAIKNQNHQLTTQAATVSVRPEFRLASTYPRLKFGVPALDKALSPLVTGDMFCVSGSPATALLESLCCQSLLPLRAGGLDAERVLYVDAGNTSQIYRFVRLARSHGLDYRTTLRKVTQTRTFTIHQLASIIIEELLEATEAVKAKAVFISDLFELFLREPNFDRQEGERLATQMARALSQVAKKCILAISLTRPSQYDGFFFAACHPSALKRLEIAGIKAHYFNEGQKRVSVSAPAAALVALEA